MGVLADRRLRWLVVALGLVAVAFVGAVGLGTVSVLSALVSLGPGESVLVALLEAAVPYLVAVFALGVAGVGLLAWTVLRAVALAELPRSDRLSRVAERVERRVPWLADVGLSEALTPTPMDRREALKERYARGEIDEREFEREMARLLDDDADDADDDLGDVVDDELDALVDRVQGREDDDAAYQDDDAAYQDDDATFEDVSREESRSRTENERY